MLLKGLAGDVESKVAASDLAIAGRLGRKIGYFLDAIESTVIVVHLAHSNGEAGSHSRWCGMSGTMDETVDVAADVVAD